MTETLTGATGPQLRRRRVARQPRPARRTRSGTRGGPSEVDRRVLRRRARPTRDAAVDAAREALPGVGGAAGWRSAPRSSARRPHAIEARAEQIAQDMTAEMGKPLREARMEAARAARSSASPRARRTARSARIYEPSVRRPAPLHARRPLGVVGLITPWNFPIAIPVWKLAPALIYGNTRRPQARLRGAAHGPPRRRGFAEAGLPAGVLNVLTGRGLEGRRGARLATRACARSRSPARSRSATPCATRRRRATAASSSSSAATTR